MEIKKLMEQKSHLLTAEQNLVNQLSDSKIQRSNLEESNRELEVENQELKA